TERRLEEPIEAAAYFVVSEALTNATKHAQASRIEVSLAPRDDSLVLSIRERRRRRSRVRPGLGTHGSARSRRGPRRDDQGREPARRRDSARRGASARARP